MDPLLHQQKKTLLRTILAPLMITYTTQSIISRLLSPKKKVKPIESCTNLFRNIAISENYKPRGISKPKMKISKVIYETFQNQTVKTQNHHSQKKTPRFNLHNPLKKITMYKRIPLSTVTVKQRSLNLFVLKF